MSPPMQLERAGILAKAVEEAGFNSLYFTEGGRTAYLSCTAAALHTRKIGIGTAVALAFTRSPMVTAQIAWELADASEGRFILGLGSQVRGHIERRYGMEFDPPGPRMRDHIGAIKACFEAFQDGSQLNFEGRFMNLSLLPREWNPGPIQHSQVPIFVSAVRPYMSRLAGEMCDGIHIHPFHSPEYVRDVMMPAVEQGAAKAGRDSSQIVLEFHTMTATGRNSKEIEKAREHARTMISFYGSTPAYAAIFEHHGFEGITSKLRELQKAGQFKEMPAVITDEMLDCYCVSASFDELGGVLYDRYKDISPKAKIMSYSAVSQWQADPDIFNEWSKVAGELNSK